MLVAGLMVAYLAVAYIVAPKTVARFVRIP
jgi:hypothetical protein